MKYTKTLILFISLIIINNHIWGQKDSAQYNKINEFDKRISLKKKYLDMNMRKETNLFKIGVAPFSLLSHSSDDYEGQINGAISFEKKLLPSLSLLFDYNIYFFGTDRYYTKWNHITDLSLRYYYNTNKNIKNLVGANNFHSNYFALKLEGITHFQYSSRRELVNWVEVNHKYRDWIQDRSLHFSWGIQRRFGNWAFIDAGPFIKYNFRQNYAKIGINMIIGLGFGK